LAANNYPVSLYLTFFKTITRNTFPKDPRPNCIIKSKDLNPIGFLDIIVADIVCLIGLVYLN
jgi:hypothetical protein